MLALNVSSDVLDGFTQVKDGLQRSNDNVAQRNAVLFNRLAEFTEQNPDKGGAWLERAKDVRAFTDDLYRLVDSLKLAIVVKADGDDADINDIKSKDDLEASSVVMLNPATLEGAGLRRRIELYRAFVTDIMVDSAKRENIEVALSTANVAANGIPGGQLWEEAQFENKPGDCRCHDTYEVAERYPLCRRRSADLAACRG